VPPLNLLLLPLLGGFIFVTRWYPTKYYSLRVDSYRLVFTSALAGAGFLLLASFLTAFISWPLCDEFWHRVVPPGDSGKSTLAMIFGLTLWWPFNRLGNKVSEGSWLHHLSDKAAVDRAITHKRDPMEMLLRKLMGQKKLVLITMKNNKIYIGNVTSNFNPAFPMESVKIFPQYSGYREKDTKQLNIGIEYDKAYKEIQEAMVNKITEEIVSASTLPPNLSDDALESIGRKVGKETGIKDFEVVLLIDEIQSVSTFDWEVYQKHFKAKEDTLPSTASPRE
jgi:hypothetical protein